MQLTDDFMLFVKTAKKTIVRGFADKIFFYRSEHADFPSCESQRFEQRLVLF